MPNYFALSLSLQVGVVAAFVAMTVTLRRPGARAWTLFWMLKITSGFVAIRLVTATPEHPLLQPRLWVTLLSCWTGATLYALLWAVWRQLRPDPAWRPAKIAAIALMVPFAFFGLTVPAGSATAADLGWYALYARAGNLPTDLLLLAVTIVFRNRTDRAAAGFLGAGFAVAIVRDVVSAAFIIPILGSAAVAASPPLLNVLQLLAMVLLALGGLLAVLAEEREALQTLAAEVERVRTYESLGRMAGGVAHDFNNLLTVIRMSVSGAPRRDGGVLLGDLEASAIDGAVEQGRQMVSSLLGFARGNAAATAVAFDLHDLIRAHEAQLRKLVPETQTLVVSLPSAPAPLFGDPSGLMRVLGNLVANARDAMPDGGRITIESTVRPGRASSQGSLEGRPRGPHVALRVSDAGPGIPADVLPRIFDPFFSTKAPGQGTGLGLALAQAYLRGSGGDIRVIQSTASGTTFELVLPLAA